MLKLLFDPIAFISKFKNPSDPNALVEELTVLFFQIDFSAKTKSDFKTDFCSTIKPQIIWTEIGLLPKKKPATTNLSLVTYQTEKTANLFDGFTRIPTALLNHEKKRFYKNSMTGLMAPVLLDRQNLWNGSPKRESFENDKVLGGDRVKWRK
ncbi:MAG: hypothetical protein IPH28_23160 [Cytophagaceae bacterium]|nr:hypothetical protein [Cytophagaceae bacterium]